MGPTQNRVALSSFSALVSDSPAATVCGPAGLAVGAGDVAVQTIAPPYRTLRTPFPPTTPRRQDAALPDSSDGGGR